MSLGRVNTREANPSRSVTAGRVSRGLLSAISRDASTVTPATGLALTGWRARTRSVECPPALTMLGPPTCNSKSWGVISLSDTTPSKGLAAPCCGVMEYRSLSQFSLSLSLASPDLPSVKRRKCELQCRKRWREIRILLGAAAHRALWVHQFHQNVGRDGSGGKILDGKLERQSQLQNLVLNVKPGGSPLTRSSACAKAVLARIRMIAVVQMMRRKPWRAISHLGSKGAFYKLLLAELRALMYALPPDEKQGRFPCCSGYRQSPWDPGFSFGNLQSVILFVSLYRPCLPIPEPSSNLNNHFTFHTHSRFCPLSAYFCVTFKVRRRLWKTAPLFSSTFKVVPSYFTVFLLLR